MKGTVARLAVFIAVCLGFTGYLGVTIGNITLFEDSYQLSATFDDVTGLLRDDDVKVAGVVVGKVTGTRIEKGKARVTFEVRTGLRLPADTAASIRWRNLLGQRYIYLYPGTAATVLEGGDAISRTRSVVDLGELFNRLGPIVQAVDPTQVNAFLDAVVGALDGNQDKVRRALDDLARLSQALAGRDAGIGRLIENLNIVAGTITARDQQIRTVLDNMVLVVQSFSENTAVLDRAVVDLTDFSDNLAFVLGRNRTEIDNLVANLRIVTDVVAGRLPTVESAVAGLDEAALRLFNASRHGEWLNQTIPCTRVGYPLAQSVSAPRCGAGGTSPGGPVTPIAPVSTQGTAAVTQLLVPPASGSRPASGVAR